MKKYLFIFILTFSFVISYAVETDYVHGQIIIQLTNIESTTISKLEAEFVSIDLNKIRLLSKRMNILLFGFRSEKVTDFVIKQQIRNHSSVLQAQFNHYVFQRELFPNDTSFDLQWNMHNDGMSGGVEDADIDAPEAWEITTNGVTVLGDTLVIAVIDGGCDLTHDDLDLWKNYNEIPNNGIDDDDNGYIDDIDGWNAYNHTGNVPTNSHGTHVSGIAGAIGNNDLGVTGVNWNAKIMPVAGSSGTESVVVEAYGYVLEMRRLYDESNGELGAFIVSTNASFGVNYGNPDDYPLWSSIYDSLGVAGVLSAAATMNINVNVDEVGDMPTACESDYLITVTNTNKFDEKSTSAAYGLETIDLGAPGSSIYSTDANNSYSYKTGTSMATPHVAGAVAMMYAVATDDFLIEYNENPGLKCLEIKQYILEGVDWLPELDSLTVSGGRLNLYNSLELMPTVSAREDQVLLPKSSLTNFPNPFNPTTTISFSLNSEITENAKLLIYNLKGQKVKVLDCHPEFIEGSIQNNSTSSPSTTLRMTQTGSTRYSVDWNGTNDNNQPVSSGIYFYRLKTKNFAETKKMILLK